MSSLYFTCTVTQAVAEAEALFALCNAACNERNPESQHQIKRQLRWPDDHELPTLRLTMQKQDSALHCFTETPPSTGIAIFESLIAALEQNPEIHYKARLFDSSSGGVQVWQQPEQELIDLEGKHLVFVGEMEEPLDEMIELAEDFAVVQTDIDEDTEVLIIGSHVDPAVLRQADEQHIRVYTEAGFWGFIQDIP